MLELGDWVGVVDRFGVAGLPLPIEALQFPLLDLDLVPVDLALELVLHDSPLRGREHGGVEATRSCGWSLGILLRLLLVLLSRLFGGCLVL